MNYIFITDSSCDLTEELVKEIGVDVLPMEFEIDGKCFQHYSDCRMMSLDEFYGKLRNDADTKTTQINYQKFYSYFEMYLKAGKDIIYTGISTGLSGTYNTCLAAVADLKEQYPDRKIIVIDSLCDSIGLGYLVYMAGKKYSEGVSIDELKVFIEDYRSCVAHWFVVDDLDRLKKGGRISAVTATFGKALQIKPLLSVDDDGKLANVGKIRGASNVFNTLIKQFERDCVNAKNEIVFVGHADNLNGALELKKRLKGMCKEIKICDIGPIIGAHVGTGMLGLVFPGQRNLKA